MAKHMESKPISEPSKRRRTGSGPDDPGKSDAKHLCHRTWPHSRYSFPVSLPKADDESDELEEKLEGLVDYVWKVYSASPLHNFRYHQADLKKYEKKLREYIACLKTDSKLDAQYETKFSIQEAYAKTVYDKEAVQVEVNEIVNTQKKNIYTGIFLSWGAAKYLSTDNSSVLPILLCRGSASVQQQVNDILFKFFDCCINPLKFSEEDLMSLTAIIMTVSVKREGKVQLSYSVPHIHSNNTIELFTEGKHLKELWDCVHDQRGSEIIHTEIIRLFEALAEEFRKKNGVCLEMCTLNSVKLPDGSFSINSKICFKSVQTVQVFLNFVHGLCLSLETVTPSLACESVEEVSLEV